MGKSLEGGGTHTGRSTAAWRTKISGMETKFSYASRKNEFFTR